MLTVILIALPMVAALLTAFAGSGSAAKKIALAAAIAEFALFLPALLGQVTDLAYSGAWVPSLGINFSVNMHGLSLLMVFLTVALVPLILLSAHRTDYNSRFYALVLLMQAALVGVFTAQDGFLFYIFWELALLPIWFICLVWGDEGRQRITLKFFLFTLFGSLFMLLGLIMLYLHTPATATAAHSFDWSALKAAGASLTATQQNWVFAAFFLAFGIKMPVFPLHTWQPDTYTNAPTQGTMLLGGIMLKMGIYGAMVWLVPVLPLALAQWQPYIIVLAVVGVVYGAIIALRQTDIKRLAAYSSFSHVGLIAAGVFANNTFGTQGAAIQMLAHGFNVVALFYIIDLIQSKANTRHINELGGIATQNRGFAVLSFIVVLGTVAMPLTNAFVGEFLLLNSIFTYNSILGGVAGLTIILGAVYMLKVYKNAFFGETVAATEGVTFMDTTASIVLSILAAIVILMGIFPQPFLQLIGA